MDTSPSRNDAGEPITIAILGAGNFGRALARVAHRRGTKVLLWSRKPIAETLPEGVRAITSLEEAATARLLFLCAPAAHSRPLLRALGNETGGGHFLVHAARGLGADGEPVSDMVRHETPIRRIGVLAGPLVPDELAAAMPSAIVVASRFPEVPTAARAALAQDVLRVYGSDDLAGVELAAALMTCIALAAGVAAGLGGGISTRALVVTRGLAQAVRVLEAMGAKGRTLAGLGGIGEVFVTASGIESPDYDLGMKLAKGMTLDAAIAALGRSAEGPEVARQVAALCVKKGVNAPIFTGIAALASGQRSVKDGVKELLGGPALNE